MVSKYLQKKSVPDSFEEVLHDFAREVLRDQPRDIIEYGALYFKALESVSPVHNFQGEEFDYPHKGKSIPPPKKGKASGAAEQQRGRVPENVRTV